jgi:hypothetical protein
MVVSLIVRRRRGQCLPWRRRCSIVVVVIVIIGIQIVRIPHGPSPQQTRALGQTTQLLLKGAIPQDVPVTQCDELFHNVQYNGAGQYHVPGRHDQPASVNAGQAVDDRLAVRLVCLRVVVVVVAGCVVRRPRPSLSSFRHRTTIIVVNGSQERFTFMPMPFYHVVIILVVTAYVPVVQNAPAALLPLRQVALHMIVHVVDAHAQNVRNAVFDQRARVTVDGVGVA